MNQASNPSEPGATPPPAAQPPKAAMPKPALGRIVHYVLPDDSPRKGEHRGAVITGITTDGPEGPPKQVNLTVWLDQIDDLPDCTVFHPFQRVTDAKFDQETKAPGTWHWPERV